MSPQESNFILTIALSLVGVFFGLLMLVIGWMGNKLYNKVDEMSKNLISMASELHTRINTIDNRLVRVEARHEICNVLNGDSAENGSKAS